MAALEVRDQFIFPVGAGFDCAGGKETAIRVARPPEFCLQVGNEPPDVVLLSLVIVDRGITQEEVVMRSHRSLGLVQDNVISCASRHPGEQVITISYASC